MNLTKCCTLSDSRACASWRFAYKSAHAPVIAIAQVKTAVAPANITVHVSPLIIPPRGKPPRFRDVVNGIQAYYFASGSNAALTFTCPLETVIFRSQGLKPVFFTHS